MRRFSRVGTMAYQPIQIVGGPSTRMIIQRPPDIDRPGSEFAAPSLVGRVAHGSLVRAGQVIRAPGGEHFLVANHSVMGDWRTFHLFHCDRQVAWSRWEKRTHPVTGLEIQDDKPTDLGMIWVMWEKVRREFTDLTLRVDQETHLVATGSDVKEQDRINGMTVSRVNVALGVNIVELKG